MQPNVAFSMVWVFVGGSMCVTFWHLISNDIDCIASRNKYAQPINKKVFAKLYTWNYIWKCVENIFLRTILIIYKK